MMVTTFGMASLVLPVPIPLLRADFRGATETLSFRSAAGGMVA